MNLFEPTGERPVDSLAVTPHLHLGFQRGFFHVFSYRGDPTTGGTRWMADEHGVFWKHGYAHQVWDFKWYWGEWGVAKGSLVGEKGELVEREMSGDLPLMWYRYYKRWDIPVPEWTFFFSLGYPILLTAILPAFWLYRRQSCSEKQR